MELYGHDIFSQIMNAFQCAVIDIDETDFRNFSVQRIFDDHVTMILRRNIHFSGL